MSVMCSPGVDNLDQIHDNYKYFILEEIFRQNVCVKTILVFKVYSQDKYI